MSYEEIDPYLSKWAEKNKLSIHKEYQNYEIRSADIIDQAGRKHSIGIEEPDGNGNIKIRACAWDYKTRHRSIDTDIQHFPETLESAYCTVMQWIKYDKFNDELSSLKHAVMYDIFAQQAFHEYFKYLKKENSLPFELPGVEDLSGNKINLFEFIKELDSINEKALVVTKRNANSFLTRNWLKETFRKTETFCKETSQIEKMQREPWHDFIRPYINAWSHGDKLNLKKLDTELKEKINKGPIIYKNKELHKGMHGEPASLELQVGYDICESIISFAKSLKS